MSGKPKPHPVYPVYPAWRSRIPWENGRKRTGPVLSVWELLFATKPKWYLLKAGYHTHKSEVWKPIESEMDSRVCLILCANFTFNILPGVTRLQCFLPKLLKHDPWKTILSFLKYPICIDAKTATQTAAAPRDPKFRCPWIMCSCKASTAKDLELSDNNASTTTTPTLCQRPKMKGNDTELIKGGNHHVGEKMKKTTPSNKSQEISSWSPT